MMCKHYNTPQGCSYGEKCQFAHGPQDLRTYNANLFNQENPMDITKTQKNIINYKIVKCKNWEKDRTCKYGDRCTFAHGDDELRNKNENFFPMANMNLMYPPPFMMDYSMMNNLGVMNPIDPNQIQQINQLMSGQIDPNQLMMGMNMNVNMNSNNADNGIIGNGNNPNQTHE